MKKKETRVDFSKFDRRCPWGSFISTRELSQILGISLQDVHNRILRGSLIEPEPHTTPRLPSGNRRFWRTDRLRAFLEGKTAYQVNCEWSAKYVESYAGPMPTLEHADFVVQAAWNLLEVEKPLFKGDFSKEEQDAPSLTQDESGIRFSTSPVSPCPTCHRPLSDS